MQPRKSVYNMRNLFYLGKVNQSLSMFKCWLCLQGLDRQENVNYADLLSRNTAAPDVNSTDINRKDNQL